jgi:hypothetical protein
LVEPDRPNRPDKPNEQDRLVDFVSNLLINFDMRQIRSLNLPDEIVAIIGMGSGWRRGRCTHKEAGSMSWLRREFGTCSRSIKNEGGETSEE